MSDVKVKQLEWERGNECYISSSTPFGWFMIRWHKGAWNWVTFENIGGGSRHGIGNRIIHPNTRNLKTAQDACQRWFEKLVRECLEVDNDPE